jgi:hypothetical protein
VLPEQVFNLGNLYYRNGSIQTTTGATGVDLSLALVFPVSLGITSISEVFSLELINTFNTGDAIASADIVRIKNPSSPLDFTDSAGNRYFLELTFKVDDTTIDGSLSTPDEFRVFEGQQGSATLLGRFTTMPIPEPSSLLLCLTGVAFLLRRRR